MSMPPAMTTIALRELGTIASIADDLPASSYDRPTALEGWTVEHLVRHVTAVALRQAEAYHRARFTVTEPPTDATVTSPIERLPATLRSVLAHTTSGVTSLDPDSEPIVPLPYASLPASLAGFVLLIEYGVHRYDLEHAITGDGALTGDVADAMADRLALTLPSLASPDEPPIRTIRLEPSGHAATTLTWRSGRWKTIDDSPRADCAVRGPADALALFVVGRITATDDRLGVDDPTGALTHFKAMFPGP
jgi:uncharacterized protein (TIGR03083 family)